MKNDLNLAWKKTLAIIITDKEWKMLQELRVQKNGIASTSAVIRIAIKKLYDDENPVAD